jgi:hypothetical protein
MPFTAFCRPFYKFCRLLKFILKSYSEPAGHIGNIFGLDIHLGQKWQTNSPPQLMANQGRDGHPHVAINELRTIRTKRWVTMNSCSLDLRPVSFCRAIVESHQDSVVFPVNQLYHKFEQYCCDCFSFSTNRTDEIVECFIPLADTRGPEPRLRLSSAERPGDSFSAFSEDGSSNDYAKPPGRALMQDAAKSYYHNSPVIRKTPFVEHWLSFANVRCFSTKHIGKDEPFLLRYQFIKELN